MKELDIINKLFLALQNIRFYPPAHSLVRGSIASVHELLQAELSDKPDFSFGFVEKKLMVNGKPLNVDQPQVLGLAQHFEILHIDNITFQSGLTLDELRSFLECLAIKPENVVSAGGLPKVLTDRNIQHVKANIVMYGRIKKESEKEKPAKAKEKTAVSTAAEDDFIKALRSSDKFAKDGAEAGKGAADEDQSKKEAGDMLFAPSPDELKELYAIRGRFYEEVDRRVKEAIQHYESENKRLAFEKGRVEAVMRHVGEGVIVVGNDGKIMMANPAAEKLLGEHGHHAVGQALKDTMNKEHSLVLSRGTMESVKEIELGGEDEDTRRVLRASNAVVQDKDGQTVGMVSVLSDITKMKEVEQLKSDFVSHVSHELRSPLVAIQKNLSVLMEQTPGAVNGTQKEFLSLAKDNLDRLTRLINDLLDLSKIEAGKMELKKEKADLVLLVRNAVQSFAGWFQEKNIKCRLDLPDVPKELELDKDRITQVMNNLLSNALKFTPNNGEIRVLMKALNPVEVSIIDSGVGIAAKDIDRIFNKFEQVSGSQTNGVHGTGLGLSLAKEIVEKHGGEISVKSEVNKGSTFTFTIPV
jgi:PAS domain S-box-containing protein